MSVTSAAADVEHHSAACGCLAEKYYVPGHDKSALDKPASMSQLLRRSECLCSLGERAVDVSTEKLVQRRDRWMVMATQGPTESTVLVPHTCTMSTST